MTRTTRTCLKNKKRKVALENIQEKQTMPQESEKKDVMKYKNDFMFLSDVMSNGDGIVQNGAVGEITFESGEIGRSG